VLNLLSYLDLFQFLLKHGVIQPTSKSHVYLVVCDQLIKVLEDEVNKYDNQNDQLPSFQNDVNIGLAAKSAVKYMKLEKHYMS